MMMPGAPHLASSPRSGKQTLVNLLPVPVLLLLLLLNLETFYGPAPCVSRGCLLLFNFGGKCAHGGDTAAEQFMAWKTVQQPQQF